MGRFRVYIKPFTDQGEYQADWLEVTQDVFSSGLSQLKRSLDNTEYDVGVFRNSSVSLNLANLDGSYSDVGQPGSIFKTRRSNSLVRFTWSLMEQDVLCGFAACGRVALSDEVICFEGLLDDSALKQNADDQNLKFSVLGKESIFDQAIVPFGSIAVGDTFEEILFACLNQAAITGLLTVDPGNISCAVNLEVDDIADLENKTVKEVLASILVYSNSVLYIKDDTVFVSARSPSADLKKTFYGQGSTAGLENIIDISDFRSGQNRLFNFLTWPETSLLAEDATSISSFGYRKKEISTDLITNNTKRQSILDAIKDEFKNPKREMILKVPIEYGTITLNVLDKVSIDYPNVGISDASAVPLWDLAVWDRDKFPNEVLPISIEATAEFKVLSKDVDPANHQVILYVREV